jgi:DNA repair exonuclease SbcCD nuclease subunit
LKGDELEFEGVVAAIGDVHGGIAYCNKMASYIRRMPPDSLLIQVGDFAIGFMGEGGRVKEERILDRLNKDVLIKYGVQLFVIRGNHQDPERHAEYGWERFSNIKFLKDYTYLTINGSRFGFVGGAISVDRLYRKPGTSWWEGEGLVLEPEKIEPCNILITHTGPDYLYLEKDIVSHYVAKGDYNLREELNEEQRKVTEIIKKSRPKRHFLGHYHTSANFEGYGCRSRILNIEEMVEVRV